MTIRQRDSSLAALAMAVNSGQSCPNHFQVTDALYSTIAMKRISEPKRFMSQGLAESPFTHLQI